MDDLVKEPQLQNKKWKGLWKETGLRNGFWLGFLQRRNKINNPIVYSDGESDRLKFLTVTQVNKDKIHFWESSTDIKNITIFDIGAVGFSSERWRWLFRTHKHV